MADRKKRGYAQKLITRISQADDTKDGVKLGKLCVRLAIPISDVAGFFGVSKPTIYTWFTGEGKPKSAELAEKVSRVIAKLQAKVEQQEPQPSEETQTEEVTV